MKKITSLTLVLTNFNRPKIILPVIDSVYTQQVTDVDIDILIIDDASTHSIESKDLDQYGDKVSVIKLKENGGLHKARNQGLKYAKGDYVLLADDDDLFLPNSLAKAISLIELLPDFENYPVYQFRRTNGHMVGDFMLVTEEHYYCSIITGDFTPIMNKKLFFEMNYMYPEFDEIKKISCENLLWADIGNRIGIPTWDHSIIELGTNAEVRLTNASNWRIKSKQFAILQKLTMNFMEEKGFDKKYPQYYQFKVQGLYIYSLLNNNKKEARSELKKYYKGKFIKKQALLLVSYLPVPLVEVLLKMYRV